MTITAGLETTAITMAKLALSRARAAHAHSPNSQNWLLVLAAEKRMNERLEAWASAR